MKTIGILGGMSWQSTVPYYQTINAETAARLGGLHSAKMLIYNVDFAELEGNMATGNWAGNADILADAAKRIEGAGADMVLIATNTMHKVAPQVQAAIAVPLVHIADAAAEALKAAGIKKAGLLGTRFTMGEDFYATRLAAHGIEAVLPPEADFAELDQIIFNELCLGKFTEKSKQIYLNVIEGLKSRGAQGVLLACTEIGLLVKDGEAALPLHDTALIHARHAVGLALG